MSKANKVTSGRDQPAKPSRALARWVAGATMVASAGIGLFAAARGNGQLVVWSTIGGVIAILVLIVVHQAIKEAARGNSRFYLFLSRALVVVTLLYVFFLIAAQTPTIIEWMRGKPRLEETKKLAERPHELRVAGRGKPLRPTIQIERLSGFLLNQPLPPENLRPDVAQYVLTIKNEDAVPLEDAVFLLKFPEMVFLDAIPEVPAGVTATWRGHYDGDMAITATNSEVRRVPGEVDDFIELQISRVGPGAVVKVPFRTFSKTPGERSMEDIIAEKIDLEAGSPAVESSSVLSHFAKLKFRYKDGESMPEATAVVGILYDPETRNIAVRLPNELPVNTRIVESKRWR